MALCEQTMTDEQRKSVASVRGGSWTCCYKHEGQPVVPSISVSLMKLD